MAIKQPRMLLRTSDSILISWEGTFNNSGPNAWYLLQIHNEFKEWCTIYWLVAVLLHKHKCSAYKTNFRGRKLWYSLSNLPACTFFKLRLRQKIDDEYTEWINFKVATSDGPPLIRHMSRAVISGEMSLIRKIVTKRFVQEHESRLIIKMFVVLIYWRHIMRKTKHL